MSQDTVFVVAKEVATPSIWTPAFVAAVSGFVGALAAAFVLVWKAVKGVGESVTASVAAVQVELKANTEITTQTRDMADGRLDDMTSKLAASESNVARLVNEGVARASTDLLAKANVASTEMLSKAQVTAVDLLAQAKREAADLLAAAQIQAGVRRR